MGIQETFKIKIFPDIPIIWFTLVRHLYYPIFAKKEPRAPWTQHECFSYVLFTKNYQHSSRHLKMHCILFPTTTGEMSYEMPQTILNNLITTELMFWKQKRKIVVTAHHPVPLNSYFMSPTLISVRQVPLASCAAQQPSTTRVWKGCIEKGVHFSNSSKICQRQNPILGAEICNSSV